MHIVFINRANKKKKKKNPATCHFDNISRSQFKKNGKTKQTIHLSHTYKSHSPSQYRISPCSAHIIHHRFSHCAQRLFKFRSIIHTVHYSIEGGENRTIPLSPFYLYLVSKSSCPLLFKFLPFSLFP